MRVHFNHAEHSEWSWEPKALPSIRMQGETFSGALYTDAGIFPIPRNGNLEISHAQ